MYKVLLWGTGVEYNNLLNLIKFYEHEGQFKVVGISTFDPHNITANDDDYFTSLDGYPLVPFCKVEEIEYDYIIICGTKEQIKAIRSQLLSIEISEDKIISGSVLQIPNFSFEKYIELHKSKISIISMNCYGGLLSNYLGLKIRSPFFNMFEGDFEYVEFLKNAKEILNNEKIVFQGMITSDDWHPYPHYKLANMNIHMNHYTDADEAEKKWYERVKRINWDNLFVTMYTEDRGLMESFSELPYKKKICFTSIKNTGIPSTAYLPAGNLPLWDATNMTAFGMRSVYDVIHLLLTGEVLYRFSD